MRENKENLEAIDLRSEEVQEILNKVPHWMIRWGNILFLSLIFILLFISWFVQYPDIIVSEALITTEIPPQKEYAKISGKLEVLLVKDNEIVLKDQPLAIMENTANYKDVFLLRSIIDTIELNKENFSFPIDQLPVLFLGDIESEYALFENNYIQYQLNRDLEPYSNEALANRKSISELNRQLQSLNSQKKISETELVFKQKDLERSKTLFKKGIISAQDYENKQLEYAQVERNDKNFESAISQIREGINNARKISRGTEISRVKEEMTLLKSVIQSFDQLKKAIKDWEYNYVFKSNIDGKVSFLNVWHANQVVNQGNLVFTIVPNKNSKFIAKLRTPSHNSGKIKAGQTVIIKLENYPDAEFGSLMGSIEKISLTTDNQGLYLIDVSLPKKLITTYNKEIDFKQEMQGSAEIITEDLRLIERFFYRLREAVKR